MTAWALITIVIFGVLLRRQRRRRRAAEFEMGKAWLRAHRGAGGGQ